MDWQRAQELLTTLADGVDPLTGGSAAGFVHLQSSGDRPCAVLPAPSDVGQEQAGECGKALVARRRERAAAGI